MFFYTNAIGTGLSSHDVLNLEYCHHQKKFVVLVIALMFQIVGKVSTFLAICQISFRLFSFFLQDLDVQAIVQLHLAHHEGTLNGGQTLYLAQFVEHEFLILFHVARAYL